MTTGNKDGGASRRRRALAVAFGALVLGAAAGAWHMIGPSGPPPNARAIFLDLHRNIYTAFDEQTESAVYDVLSRSVDGPLMSKLYNEVYQSLVRQDLGGAISRVSSVTVMSTDIAASTRADVPGANPFDVKALWLVVGHVTHESHTHARLNRYEGVFTIADIDGDWKIVDDRILSQTRLSDDQAPVAAPTSDAATAPGPTP